MGFIMTSVEKVGTCKNLFCRDKCWRLINNYYGGEVFASVPGARLRNCSYGEKCRGAHTEDEIHTLPHVHNFNMLDKSKIDLVSIYFNIIKVFESSKSKVLNRDFKEKLNNYEKLNFVELMNLWFDLSCYHRKLKKDMIVDDTIKSEFASIKQIPEFILDDETIIWSLERITKMCPKNKELIRKINSPKEKPVIWDICLASINCKLGCHNSSNMVCNDDLLTGVCNCLSQEEYDSEKTNRLQEIAILKEQLNPNSNSGFQSVKINKKKRNGIQKRINKLTEELRGFSRKIHLTEQGMIPFEKQLFDYEQKQMEIKKEADKKICDRKQQMKKVVKKKILKPVF